VTSACGFSVKIPPSVSASSLMALRSREIRDVPFGPARRPRIGFEWRRGVAGLTRAREPRDGVGPFCGLEAGEVALHAPIRNRPEQPVALRAENLPVFRLDPSRGRDQKEKRKHFAERFCAILGMSEPSGHGNERPLSRERSSPELFGDFGSRAGFSEPSGSSRTKIHVDEAPLEAVSGFARQRRFTGRSCR